MFVAKKNLDDALSLKQVVYYTLKGTFFLRKQPSVWRVNYINAFLLSASFYLPAGHKGYTRENTNF